MSYTHSHVRAYVIILTIFIGLLGIGFYAASKTPEKYDIPLTRTIKKEIEDATNGTGAKLDVKEFTNEPAVPPATMLIEVPFIVQAPTGNWDMPYQEACEEASLIMIHHFLAGETLTAQEADKEILDMVQWENDEFNYSADLTIEELKRVAEDYYKHTGQLFYDFTIDDMKRLLVEGHPLIVPLSGRDVGNPYYSGEGPWYHMLVVTGYDAHNFITNDVGTKRGHNFRFPQERFFNSIHNWTGQKEDIRNGRKAMLVLEK